MKRFLLIFICLWLYIISDCTAQCNGYPYLCDRKYNEVAYLTTHNAFNSTADGFLMPNQNNSITQQLNDGVRGFMLDVYDVGGVPTVYHGFAILGSKPLSYNLGEIKTFLDNNPNEIITIILECYVSATAIENSLASAGLLTTCFAKDTSAPWPTLQEMINAGKKLVIFSDVDDASLSQPWYHYVWDYAVETNYSVNDTSQFTCDYNRGDSLNDLFIFNHFVTTPVTGTGSIAQSSIANANPFFTNRILECMTAKNKFANFLTVDFYELGSTFAALNTVNNLNWWSAPDEGAPGKAVQIWTEQLSGSLHIDFSDPGSFTGGSVEVINVLGQEIALAKISGHNITLNLSEFGIEGVLIIRITDKYGLNVKIAKVLLND